MTVTSRKSRQKSWQRRREEANVLAEMALRQERVVSELVRLRERHGLSQEQAAQRAGVTGRQWQRWESGESMPYPRNLSAVADSFGISMTAFFDEEETEEPTGAYRDQLNRIEAKLDALLVALAGAGTDDVDGQASLASRIDAVMRNLKIERPVDPDPADAASAREEAKRREAESTRAKAQQSRERREGAAGSTRVPRDRPGEGT
jgi:transcriptional regulator with XRE-family HTH domain